MNGYNKLQQQRSYHTQHCTPSFKSSFVVFPVDKNITKDRELRVNISSQLSRACKDDIFVGCAVRIGSSSTVVVTCLRPHNRATVLSNKRVISASCGLIMDAYLTPKQLQNRASLAMYYAMLQSNGMQPHWKLDKLFYMHEGVSTPFHPFCSMSLSLMKATFSSQLRETGTHATRIEDTLLKSGVLFNSLR